MTSSNDQEYYETYLNHDDDNEIIQSLKNELEIENAKDCKDDYSNENGGTIIVDADGNYYFQTSDKMVKVEPLKKVAQSPAKKVAATAVTTLLKRKGTTPPVNVSNKKTKLETNTNQKDQKNNEDTVGKNIDETIISEAVNQKEVYEFDENEQDADDPRDEADADYGSKGVVKSIEKSTTNKAGSFNCMICPYQTSKKFLLSRHLKTHSDDRPYKCSVCERGFKTNASLMNHRNTHLGYKPHVCKDCDKAFTTSGELVRHVRYRHTHIKPHKCTECDYSSVEMSKLRRHMRCHTGERPYQCPHCTYASPDTFKLKRHMRIHTGEKPYECDICHARFTQSNSLKHHRLIHSVNDKPVFQCHLCPTTCGRKTDLRLHIKKLHSSDQPIPCKRCGKELADRYSYKMHIKTHEGEKCYRCEFCPYASISQRHLESHVFIHLDAKPFVCEICQTSFRQKQLLTRHMRVYHSDNYEPPQPRKKDHKCPHCNKMFAFNGNLIRHMEVHDPTSRLSEKKYSLKLGRMKRVQTDGTIVTLSDVKQFKTLSDDNEYIYEETEIENEKINEEEYEEDYNNEDNIQYVYEELDGIEYEEDQENEEEEEDPNGKKSLIKVKIENFEAMENIQSQQHHLTKVKSENEVGIMSVEVHDDQNFMVIEVLPDDDDDDDEVYNEEQTPQQLTPKIIYEEDGKTTVIKNTPNKEPTTSDYFGFEVDEEEFEETKGAIKLLEIIKQE